MQHQFSWQKFDWYSALRGLSAVAELIWLLTLVPHSRPMLSGNRRTPRTYRIRRSCRVSFLLQIKAEPKVCAWRPWAIIIGGPLPTLKCYNLHALIISSISKFQENIEIYIPEWIKWITRHHIFIPNYQFQKIFFYVSLGNIFYCFFCENPPGLVVEALGNCPVCPPLNPAVNKSLFLDYFKLTRRQHRKCIKHEWSMPSL